MQRIRRRLRLPGLILAAWVMGSGVGLAQNPPRAAAARLHVAPSLVRILPSVPESGKCVHCHPYGVDPIFQKVSIRECLACHSAGLPRGVVDGLQKVGQRTLSVVPAVKAQVAESVEEASAKAPFPPAEGQGPGMHVPMYYARTRMGAEPHEMALIPAGEFVRGTNQRLSDEGPQHHVWLGDFYIDKYEVTNLQYQRFINDTHRKSPDHFENRTFPEGKADHPVTLVSWHDAKAYCEAVGKRLPTDQEWEKAARGTDGRTYPWGEVFDITKVNSPVRWGNLKLQGDTTPVGAFDGGVSPYGVHDMSGNVWEWTDSWYLPYPGNTKITENYGEKYKVLKGGSWWDCSFYKCGISAPVYNRSFFLRNTKNKSFGFRCAKDFTAPAVKGSL